MIKIFVMFFAGLGLASATGTVNPFTPTLVPFLNRQIPTESEMRAAIVDVIVATHDMFLGQFLTLEDVVRSLIRNNGDVLAAGFTDGKLYGIDTMFQNKNVEITHDDSVAHLQVHYEFANLTAVYNWYATYNGVGGHGKVFAEFLDFSMYVHVIIDRNTTNTVVHSVLGKNTGSASVRIEDNNGNDVSFIGTLIALGSGTYLDEYFEEILNKKVYELVAALAADYNSHL